MVYMNNSELKKSKTSPYFVKYNIISVVHKDHTKA
jgi:hypothetical protein